MNPSICSRIAQSRSMTAWWVPAISGMSTDSSGPGHVRQLCVRIPAEPGDANRRSRVPIGNGIQRHAHRLPAYAGLSLHRPLPHTGQLWSWSRNQIRARATCSLVMIALMISPSTEGGSSAWAIEKITVKRSITFPLVKNHKFVSVYFRFVKNHKRLYYGLPSKASDNKPPRHWRFRCIS